MKRHFIAINLFTFLMFAAITAIAGTVTAQDNGDLEDGSEFNIEIDQDFDEDDLFRDQEVDPAAAAAAATAALIMMIVNVVISLGGLIFIIWVMVAQYSAASSIPTEHQQVNPGLVFLLIVPCVNLIMGFILFPGIAKGFKSYFDSVGRTDAEDTAGFAMATAVCMFIPCVNLIMLLLLTLKFSTLKKQLQAA